jgi:alanyl-tRNA synthetase
VTGEGLQHFIQEQVRKIGSLDDQLSKLVEEKEALEKQLGRKSAAGGVRPSPGRIPGFQGHPTLQHLQTLEGLLREREQWIGELSDVKAAYTRDLSRQRVREEASSLDGILAKALDVLGTKVVSARVGSATLDELKSLGDSLREKIGSGVGVLGSVIDGKVALVCVVTDDLIQARGLKAGSIVGAVAKMVGGGGGGKPHLATAGGKDAGKLDEALEKVPEVIRSFAG